MTLDGMKTLHRGRKKKGWEWEEERESSEREREKVWDSVDERWSWEEVSRETRNESQPSRLLTGFHSNESTIQEKGGQNSIPCFNILT